MTEPVWHFGVECVNCHEWFPSALVDPSSGDRGVDFAGPGKMGLRCTHCRHVAQYDVDAFRSRPDGESSPGPAEGQG